jgi:hypothetical protein
MEDPVPFQVQLERRQHRQLKTVADRRGASMGALIRESVAAYLGSLPPEEDPLYGLIGSFPADEGPQPYGDVALHHDAYLADFYASEVDAPQDPLEEERTAPPDGRP